MSESKVLSPLSKRNDFFRVLSVEALKEIMAMCEPLSLRRMASNPSKDCCLPLKVGHIKFGQAISCAKDK